jgi:hypothetical protein
VPRLRSRYGEACWSHWQDKKCGELSTVHLPTAFCRLTSCVINAPPNRHEVSFISPNFNIISHNKSLNLSCLVLAEILAHTFHKYLGKSTIQKRNHQKCISQVTNSKSNRLVWQQKRKAECSSWCTRRLVIPITVSGNTVSIFSDCAARNRKYGNRRKDSAKRKQRTCHAASTGCNCPHCTKGPRLQRKVSLLKLISVHTHVSIVKRRCTNKLG